MSEHRSENSEMSCVEFGSHTLREKVAPAGSAGSVKERIRLASRRLGWTFSRTKDVWYADPRVSLGADELRAIEETSGVRYGREELRKNDAIIARAEALLDGADENFVCAFVAALRAVVGAEDRS